MFCGDRKLWGQITAQTAQEVGFSKPPPSPLSPLFQPSPSTNTMMLPHKEQPNTNPKPRRKPPSDPAFVSGTTTVPACTECGKRFSSWKALFGHMRCHPERQWRGINPPPRFRCPNHQLQLVVAPTPNADNHPSYLSIDEYEVAASLLLLANGPRKASRAYHHKRVFEEVGGHRCGVCDRGFSSGQALGGHMRCHWEHYAATAAASSSGMKHLVLDLNMPPPVEADSCLDLSLGMG